MPAVAQDPGAFDGGLTLDNGTEWLVAVGPVASTPRLTVPSPWHDCIRLSAACRAGRGGAAYWPDPGGVGDQAAWIVDSFAMLTAIDATLDNALRRGRAGQAA